MANEEIIDLLDLVERGKGAASPSSSRGASDFKRELDDLFSDEPESADAGHAETYDRKARPSGNAAAASGKAGQAVDFNEKLDMPDMSDLDGLLEGLGAKDEEPEPLEDPDPVMHFPDSMKDNAAKMAAGKLQPSTFNLDDLHDDIDQLIAEDSRPEPSQTDGDNGVELDNLDSLLDDILNSSDPKPQEEEAPSLGADDLFDEIAADETAADEAAADEEIPGVLLKGEGNRPVIDPVGGAAESRDRRAMERSVLFAANADGDDAFSAGSDLSGVSGLSEDDVRALVREEIAPLSEAASPERLAEAVRKELASLPPSLTEDDVRELVGREIAAAPASVSPDEARRIAREEFAAASEGFTPESVRALVREEIAPLSEAVSPEHMAGMVREELASLPEALTEETVRGLVSEGLAAAPKSVSLEEVKELIHAELAAIPAPASSDEIKEMIREELSAPSPTADEPVTVDVVRALVREEIAPLSEAVSPERITEAVRAQVAWWPRPFTADDIRGIVCKELTAAPKPASPDEIKGMIREELAAMPKPFTPDEIRDMAASEIAALPKPMSSEDVRVLAREEIAALPKPLSADDVRALVHDERADAPKPVSIDDIRELVQAEIFAAISDNPPVTASQIRGVVREELDLRFADLEERLAAKVLEAARTTIEQAAAKAAATVIREEIAALAEEL